MFLIVTVSFFSSVLDPNMVNAYMYPAPGTNGQPAPPPGQAPPTSSPPYSNYQPTPSQGYQVWSTLPFLLTRQFTLEILEDNDHP